MSVMESWPLFFLQSFLILLPSVLLPFNPLLAFSLKNCTVDNNVTWVECADRDLTGVPDDILITVVTLDLNFNHISKINRTDFSRFSKLGYLKIANNLISHVDDGAFAEVELIELDMGSNNLINLTDYMFQGLWKLIFLSVEKNHITNISPLAFQSLISLQTLQLTYNNLHQITDIVPILQLPNLNDLLADFNSLSSFQSDDLPFNKSNLRTLWLSSDSMKKFSITRDVFPHLQSIHLNANAGFEWDVPDPMFLRTLTTLDVFVFDNSCEMYQVMLKSAESVRELSLLFWHHDRERDLVDIACQMTALTSLHLSGISFVSINKTFLQSCTEITELDLSYNNLEELSEFSLGSIKQLRRLDIVRNSLSRVPQGVRGLSTLEILDLSVNFISELDCSDFQNLTKLVELNLSQNRISTLKGCVFQDLNDLKVLNVAENGVHLLVDFFKLHLQKLEVLDLNMNTLMQLKTDDFKNMSSLRSLYLESDTFYVAHKGAFEGLDNLQNLSVTPFFGEKVSITKVFTGLQHLENLKIHLTSSYDSKSSRQKNETLLPIFPLPFLKSLLIRNYDWHHEISPDFLTGLNSLDYFGAEKLFTESPHPDTFKYTPLLTSLHIFQSDLQVLNPEVLQPILNLQALDLSKNKLRSLDFLAQVNLSALRVLTVRDNELTVINEMIFQSLPALTYLDLTGNPFTCNCSNTGFIQWVKNNNQTQVVNAYQYTCTFPVAKQGTKLLDFDIQPCWMDVSFVCFISSFCLTLMTLLTSFIYHFLRWQLAYTYYLFLAFLYDSRKRKKGAPHHYDAFISYNIHDEDWVYREMLPVLEGEQGWRLCLHHRDFQPGKPIIDNITDAIYGSRKTICVITRRYLQSEWCSREIQMASFRLFDEQKDVLILLFLEEILAHQLSPYHRMRKLVKRRTYLSWPQAGQHTGVFWQNVWRALETGEAPIETNNLLTGC